MVIEFAPISVIGSGYAGKSGVAVALDNRGKVCAALAAGTLTHEQLEDAEQRAYAVFVEGGNFPGYIPTLRRVTLEV